MKKRKGRRKVGHQVKGFWRVIFVVLGGLLLAGAALTGSMLVQGKWQGGYGIEAALLAGAAGPLIIWQGLYRQGKRVLVFPEGIVNLSGHRPELWPWDQIETVWLKPDAHGEVAIRMVSTIVRRDGHRFAFSADIEYLQNQLVARAQHEVCRRLLPEVQQRVEAGGTVEFGPLRLTAEGIDKDRRSLAWSDVRGFELEPSQVVIHAPTGKWTSVGLADIPNPALFCAAAEYFMRKDQG